MDHHKSLFKAFNLITTIPNEHSTLIKDIFYYEELKKGSFYCKEGEYSTTFSFLITGIMKGYYITSDGEEFIKTFRKNGQFIASYRSLLLKEKSTYNASALTNCTLLTVKFSDFEQLMEKYFCWQKLVRLINQYEFIKKEEREYQLLTMSLKERYIEFLNDFEEVHHLIPQHQIASFLGVKAPSLSRMLKTENLKKTSHQ